MDNTMSDGTDSTILRIGALAAEFGLNPKTIRFYEDIGLLPEPERSATGYRLYGDADRERLHFVVKAKQVGFTLEEIADIFLLQGHGKQPCGHVVELLDEKIRATDEQLRALLGYRERLLHVRTAAASQSDASAYVCGIIEHQDEATSCSIAPPQQPLANRAPAVSTRRPAP